MAKWDTVILGTASVSAKGGYRYILEGAGNGADGLRFYLDVGCHTVGRGAVDVHLPFDDVSREHCVLEVLADGGVIVRDAGSTNGTRVDGRRVSACALQQPAQLAFGDYPFRLLPEPADGLALLLTEPSEDGDAPRVPDGPATLRPDREVELWTTAFQALADSFSDPTATFPGEAWLSAIRDALDANALQLRHRENDAIVAAVGASSSPLHELAAHGAWSLYGDVRGAIPALSRMLAALPLPAGAEMPEAPRVTPETGTVQPGLHRALLDARRVAQSGLSILIYGESGTGKEWTARWLHEQSPRAAGPFYALNCAAIPDDLLEAELFGIEAGVATGVDARTGVFARAGGGTLFLDEIGEMAPRLQAKLLRALDSGEIVPVGSRSARNVDVRVLSATNRDLEKEILDGTFRSDLFYRLAAHSLPLPPLRSRREDVPALVSAFYRAACKQAAVQSPGITTRAMQVLVGHDWPGNIRQLRFTIERAVQLLASGAPLDLPQLPEALTAGAGAPASLKLRDCVARAEAQALRTALQAADGEISEACRLLGIGRSTFYDKARALDVDPSPAASST